MIRLSEFRRHYSGNCMGLTQMRCICVHPLGSLCCAICHIPTQGLFFHLNTGFCHVHQLQPFSFFSFAIPIAYSLLDITIIFVTLKNSIFLGPSSHWLITFPSFITKFLEIVVCTLCHQFLFSKSLAGISLGFSDLQPSSLYGLFASGVLGSNNSYTFCHSDHYKMYI